MVVVVDITVPRVRLFVKCFVCREASSQQPRDVVRGAPHKNPRIATGRAKKKLRTSAELLFFGVQCLAQKA